MSNDSNTAHWTAVETVKQGVSFTAFPTDKYLAHDYLCYTNISTIGPQ